MQRHQARKVHSIRLARCTGIRLQGAQALGTQAAQASGAQGTQVSGTQGAHQVHQLPCKGTSVQLQGVVAGIVSPKANERYEAIQPGVSSLPALLESGPEACFEFSDWLHSSRPALSDISHTSENLWEGVVKEAAEWYREYLKTDILGRLSAKPTPSPFLKQQTWARVSRRIETMLIQAAPASAQEELNPARVSGLLPVVCRLYVIYGPGGLNERETRLRQIQDPNPGTTVADTVEILRK